MISDSRSTIIIHDVSKCSSHINYIHIYNVCVCVWGGGGGGRCDIFKLRLNIYKSQLHQWSNGWFVFVSAAEHEEEEEEQGGTRRMDVHLPSVRVEEEVMEEVSAAADTDSSTNDVF